MKNKDWWFAFGAILVLAGAVLQISNSWFAPYVVGVGAIFIFVLRVISSPKDADFRVRRLMRIQLFGSLLIVASAYFMFTNNNAWALALLLAAVIDIFVMIRLPKDKG